MRSTALMLALLAGCPSGDETDDQVVVQQPEVYCGALSATLLPGEGTYWIEPPRTCMVIGLEDAANPGHTVDSDFTGAVAVKAYVALPFPADDVDAPGGDCVFTGVDSDGFAGGLLALLDDSSGHCSQPPLEVAGSPTARVFWPRTGSLTQLESGNWALQAQVQVKDYYYEVGEPLLGDSFSWSGGLGMEAAPFPDEPLSWPAERFLGDCGVESCLSASDWTADIREGEGAEGCTRFVDEVLPAIGTPLYSVRNGGNQVLFGTDWKTFAQVPDSCVFGGSTDVNWTNAIDHDAARITATYRGVPVYKGVLPVACTVHFSASLEVGGACE